MPSTLIFPDGVRLANREELPGPESERATLWARIEAANIAPGFVLTPTDGERFTCYVEANVDAPSIWPIFRDLSRALIEPKATLLFGELDDEPRSLVSGDITTIIEVLSRHEYQLAHDGYLQFGLVSDDDAINEVFVAPTKHLKVWLNDEARFKAVMHEYGVREVDRLEFLDQYPRTTATLPTDQGVLRDAAELALQLHTEVTAKERPT
jgi:hypothetical protein